MTKTLSEILTVVAVLFALAFLGGFILNRIADKLEEREGGRVIEGNYTVISEEVAEPV